MTFTDHDGVALRRLAHASVHRWTYLADQEVEISNVNGAGEATIINVEVEYWHDGNQAIVAAVRVWEHGVPGATIRCYLPSPNWLQEILIAAIDTSKLPQGEPDL